MTDKQTKSQCNLDLITGTAFETGVQNDAKIGHIPSTFTQYQYKYTRFKLYFTINTIDLFWSILLYPITDSVTLTNNPDLFIPHVIPFYP